MSDSLRAEWLKAWTGRTWLLLTAIGALMSLTTTLGYATDGAEQITGGLTTAAAVTDEGVRAWMMMFLFSSLFGAVSVTREYTSGAIGRSVLLGGGRNRLFSAKVLVAAAMGAISGALAVVLGAISTWGATASAGVPFTWTSETTLVAAGVFAVTVAAAPWGVLVGWLIRNQIGAVVTLMGLTLVVDPALQRLVPDAAKFLLTIAMSSVYRDGKPELLTVPLACLVIAAWLGAAGLLARKALLSRDVL